MGKTKQMMMDIEMCDEIDDQYNHGEMLEIEYKGETRRVQFIKPIYLAKAGAGFMAVHDGKHKTFAMEHCTNIHKIDECLIGKDEDKDAKADGSKVAELEKEMSELRMENSELQMMIGHLETQVGSIRNAVSEAFGCDD